MSKNLIDQSYEIVDETVAAENVEGEVVIVHFDTGSYFSLRSSAATAWEELVNGGSPAELASKIDSPTEIAMEQLTRFLGVLVDEGLIRVSSEDASPISSDISLKMEELVVEKYEDMQLLLLGDPIHDVESEGWPKMQDGSVEG